MRTYFRQAWSRSKMYRIAIIIAALFASLRLVSLWTYFWVEESEFVLPSDLQIYREATINLQLQRDLYLEGKLPADDMFYQYPPAYALVFSPFIWLPDVVLLLLLTLLNLLVYGLLYVRWGQIFQKMGLDRVSEMMAWTLPIWIIYSSFWYLVDYLNVGVFVALSATLLIEAVMEEHLGRSVLWLSIILQTKPPWAFAIAVPLLLGRWRFFFKVMALTIVSCVAIVGTTILITGLPYGWQQHVEYLQHLWNFRSDWPWRGPDASHLGYNHSITQIFVYLAGVTPTTLRLATGIKVLLLVPLAAASLRCLARPAKQAGHAVPRLSLELAFVLYLGSYIWLDMIYEVFLGIVAFVYLATVLNRQGVKILAWVIFLIYALADIWYAVGLAGPISDKGDVLWDPNNHIPIVMIVILTLYTLLVKRLWHTTANRSAWGIEST